MNKVIGSRVDLNDDNNKYAVEFRTYIEDLFDNDTVQKLDRLLSIFILQDYSTVLMCHTIAIV